MSVLRDCTMMPGQVEGEKEEEEEEEKEKIIVKQLVDVNSIN